MSLKNAVIKTGLNSLYFTGGHHLLQGLVGGVGSILTFHHVRPARADAFQPNRLLEITPEFLERVLRHLVRSGMDVISLDEMHERMMTGRHNRRFVCLTFDDGYRDNYQWAYPLLKQFNVPFTIYIPTSFPDRIGEMWWLVLERVIAQNSRVGLSVNGHDQFFDCRTVSQKRELFQDIYVFLRSLKTEEEMRKIVRDLAACHGVDIPALCEEQCMTWEDIYELSRDPLVTIAAHTVNHVMLKKVPDDNAVRAEMQMSRSVIEAAIGKRPEHLSYPVGDKTSAGPREFEIAAELGFKTAVTTRPGVLFRAHREHMTALPRISVNGDFARQRYVKVLMSGAATALWNRFRRVNAA